MEHVPFAVSADEVTDLADHALVGSYRMVVDLIVTASCSCSYGADQHRDSENNKELHNL